MRDQYYFIKNIEGTLCYFNIEVCEFSIKNKELIYFKDLSGGNYYPWEIACFGPSYRNFNDWFNRRVVKDGAQDIRKYLNDMGLEYYDFEELIKRNNGSNHGPFWIKFKNVGAKSWDELQHTHMPIYK
ncbi:MAG: hypothetical protein J6A59_15245 [Lachnospiraceae bacterium]|nr:hypothetical protein [Lachnospiraceae bacterium]